MTARAVFEGKVWKFDGNKENAWTVERQAKCDCGIQVPVLVTIPKDLSSTGKKKTRICNIDRCAAPIVDALQKAGIEMRGSCCGHGESDGYIALQDGRYLMILESHEEAVKRREMYSKKG